MNKKTSATGEESDFWEEGVLIDTTKKVRRSPPLRDKRLRTGAQRPGRFNSSRGGRAAS